MTLNVETRASDSPYIDTIAYGRTLAAGSAIRPAEIRWHMVFSFHDGGMHPIFTGPLPSAGTVSWGGGAEILWIRLKLGVFMPRLPTLRLRGKETLLPVNGRGEFCLEDASWQFPTFENADTFVDQLARTGGLVLDPLIGETLEGRSTDTPSRTLRHRFLHVTGLTQAGIRQYERASRAASLLGQGRPIVDTAFELGYTDQPHLTRSLKRWIGFTPAQLRRQEAKAWLPFYTRRIPGGGLSWANLWPARHPAGLLLEKEYEMQKITPCLWFNGQAEEAAKFYTSLFKNSRITDMSRYGEDTPGQAGTVMTVAFELDGNPFTALNGGPEFKFNEAISFMVDCKDQEEVDRLWNAFISSGGEESVCGWLKDKFGVSWQIIPEALGRLLSDPDPERASRAMQAMLQMKKIDVAALERAAAGVPAS